MFTVHDTGTGEIETFDTEAAAQKCYDDWKEIKNGEIVEEGSEIIFSQAIKKAVLVEIPEPKDDPRAEPGAKWVRFEDVYLENE